MHGHQLQVILRSQHAARRSIGGQHLESWNRRISPSQVDAHDPGEQHPDKSGGEGQRVILLADHLMVQAEHVFPDKTCRSLVLDRVG
jgi:hypothetical protein